jgi:hypothetical protein
MTSASCVVSLKRWLDIMSAIRPHPASAAKAGSGETINERTTTA